MGRARLVNSWLSQRIRILAVLCLLPAYSAAETIDEYTPGPMHTLSNVSQASALFTRDNEICLLQNGGGRLLCRTDLTDPDTTVLRRNHQGGCSDIEGGWAYGDFDLYADEDTPARVYFMAHGGRKCSEALRTVTLTGMDESRNSFGIEGISVLSDGRIVVVKERSPVRVAVFSLIDSVDSYSPTDLFDIQDCSKLGDVSVKEDGNILIICKSPKKIQEYSVGGALLGELPIPQFNQPEGIAEIEIGVIAVLGEPNQYQVFSASECESR